MLQPIPTGVTLSNALSKLKAQSSKVSFHWNVVKETFQLWAFENDTLSGIGCTCIDWPWIRNLLFSTYWYVCQRNVLLCSVACWVYCSVSCMSHGRLKKRSRMNHVNCVWGTCVHVWQSHIQQCCKQHNYNPVFTIVHKTALKTTLYTWKLENNFGTSLPVGVRWLVSILVSILVLYAGRVLLSRLSPDTIHQRLSNSPCLKLSSASPSHHQVKASG